MGTFHNSFLYCTNCIFYILSPLRRVYLNHTHTNTVLDQFQSFHGGNIRAQFCFPGLCGQIPIRCEHSYVLLTPKGRGAWIGERDFGGSRALAYHNEAVCEHHMYPSLTYLWKCTSLRDSVVHFHLDCMQMESSSQSSIQGHKNTVWKPTCFNGRNIAFWNS